MSRHGWTRQESYQPYPAGTVPHVTNEDFSYITSEDIEPYPADPRYSNPTIINAPDDYEEDDVLHIVLPKGREYQLQFPAYSIGDGKLRVRDIQSRIAFLRGIPEHRIPYISLYYKSKRLKDPGELARSYGCKNNSELVCIIPDRWPDEVEEYRDTFGGSGSESETVVVTDEHGRVINNPIRGRSHSSIKRRSPRTSGTSLNIPSPRTSSASLNVPSSPIMGNFTSKRASSEMRETPANPALKKLEEISEHFETQLKPLCEEFARSPPADRQKREDEHKKLEETTMQQVLLKLDEVQGGEDVRTKRKALVNRVQAALKMIDNQK